MDKRALVEGRIASFGISLDVLEFLMIFIESAHWANSI